MSDLVIPLPPSMRRPQRLSDQILVQIPSCAFAIVEAATLRRWVDKTRTLEWAADANAEFSAVSRAASWRAERVTQWRVHRSLWWRLRRWWRG